MGFSLMPKSAISTRPARGTAAAFQSEDEPLRGRRGELSVSQLVVLRFASDAELPGLAAKTLSEKQSRANLKKAAGQWRPDYWRV